MEGNQTNVFTESSRVPFRWVLALCSVIATLAIAYASMKIGMMENATADVKGEIRSIRESISSLNINVSVLLNERDRTKEEIQEIKIRMDRFERKKQPFRGPATDE